MAKQRRKSQLWVARVEEMCGEHPEQVTLLGQAANLNDGFKEIKRLTVMNGREGRYVLLRQVSGVLMTTIQRTEKAVFAVDARPKPLPDKEPDQEATNA